MSGTITMTGEEYDALRAEAEALRAENERLSEELDKTELRALKFIHQCNAHVDLYRELKAERDQLSTELEAARGLLAGVVQRCSKDHGGSGYVGMDGQYLKPVNTFLTATQAPEVQAEQGERQEAVAWVLANSVDEIDRFAPIYYTKEGAIRWTNGRNIFPLYTIPQPGPDVRALAAFALEMIDGAWEGGSFDGGDIQDAGVRHGLLAVEQRYESCGEHCDCAEYGFPAECYRLTPALAAHHQTQQGDSNDT